MLRPSTLHLQVHLSLIRHGSTLHA
jgi:hypothetical protein